MKEVVGESAMTIITISLVAGTVIAIGLIISTLLNNQRSRANCENAGYDYSGGQCKDGDKICTYNKDLDDYICG